MGPTFEMFQKAVLKDSWALGSPVKLLAFFIIRYLLLQFLLLFLQTGPSEILASCVTKYWSVSLNWILVLDTPNFSWTALLLLDSGYGTLMNVVIWITTLNWGMEVIIMRASSLCTVLNEIEPKLNQSWDHSKHCPQTPISSMSLLKLKVPRSSVE